MSGSETNHAIRRGPETAYVTTPIYYVNDRPHIGHAYTTTLCDVWARFMRIAGRDVFFLTGTDEHGVKVEKSARERGISPQALADENAAEFRRVLGLFGLSNDDFIRTTEPRHERQVQRLLERLEASGAVHLGEFEGWYDEGQEEYHTETKAKELDYKSPVTGRPLVRAKESNYYFRLSAFAERLEKHFEAHPDFVRPVGRRNEVLGRLRDGLQDVPITRTNFSWGIPMPGAEGHVVYVWIDALFNYATALGLGEEDPDASDRAKYWPADFHVIGKEILWFHAVIWPALLMALDLPLPKCVYAHAFWIADGQKMSKSLGNFVDLESIGRYHERYGLDAWRWFMSTRGPLGAADADFREDHFADAYLSDLVNTVGNGASRVTAMAERYFEGNVPCPPEPHRTIDGQDWSATIAAALRQAHEASDTFAIDRMADAGLSLFRALDGFIHRTEPFKLAKDPARRDDLARILHQSLEVLFAASALLWPLMPASMDRLRDAIGQPRVEAAGTLEAQVRLDASRRFEGVAKIALFPRVEAASS